ncbi:MAG TPA: folylpolyglutamate synthase/dihydrofolate synthase family protein [Microbacteriaceae bacterium]|nr:folylpolyglutamate synthase/dihydrofolate synthase family protein [Microbacteriaceae bacterium]
MVRPDSAGHRVYEELLSRSGEASPRPRIEPVRRLARYLGDPQLTFPVVHVAGTNGKTSTARAIEVLLRAHGIRTGLFTSPHLINFEERILIDGDPISELALVDAWEEMQTALKLVDEELQDEGQSPITFFEALAVLAFVAFTDAPIEVAVIEVGMGGEWDATNIVDSSVSVFTPIGLEHTKILGSDLKSIAETKSGIIKSETIVVSAAQEDEALQVLQDRAEQYKSNFYLYGQDFSLLNDIGAVGGRMFDAQGLTKSKYEHVLLPLFGRYQSENALLAIAAVEAYFGTQRAIDQDVLSEAFANLTAPGRLHAVSNRPLVLVDSAHNPHGISELIKAVTEHFTWEEILVVVGALDDKDINGVVKQLLTIATKVYTTDIASDRSLASEDLATIVQSFDDSIEIDDFESTSDALTEAHAWAGEKDGRVVLVAGSVLLAGEAIVVSEREGWTK